MILLALTFRLLDAIRLFDTIFIMTGGGPGTQTYTASFYLYTSGFTQFHLVAGDSGEAWLFLIHHRCRSSRFLVRRLLKVETRMMASQERFTADAARRSPSRASCFSASSCSSSSAPLYWMFDTSIKPSDDYLAIPPVWWPSAADHGALRRRRSSPIAARGPGQLLIIVASGGDRARRCSAR